MSLKSEIRARVYADRRLKTLFWMGNSAAVAARGRLSLPSSRNGSRHKAKSVAESLAYLERVFGDYKRYGRIERFAGRVVELGPGDSAGTAMLMRGDGAERVDLVDRYHIVHDAARQSRVYAALAERHGLEALRRDDGRDDGDGDYWDEHRLDGIRWHSDATAERFLTELAEREPGSCDAIVSRAVLEHVLDPLLVIERGVECLRPGGKLVHMVDFRDHGYYSREHDELTFLELSARLWPLLVRGCGGPNRVLLHRYRERLERLARTRPVRVEVLVSHLVGVGAVEPYRPFDEIDPELRARARDAVERRRARFAAEFRDAPADDLCVSGICLVVERTA